MGKQDAMSKKLKSWLGRSFKATKLRSYLGITITRLSVIRNQPRARWEQARCDVAESLRQGKHERALLRTDQIIKEQNMLDAFDMVESYCHILSERADLLESHRECPEELREAISSLVFADSRCGQLPELHEVRSILASRLGKEFVSSAVELRNSCGVNPTIIQKLSTKQPTIEMKWKVVKDMAAELGIDLPLQEPSPEIPTEASGHRGETARGHPLTEKVAGADDILSESVKAKQKYKDATSAAQAAFESAAYAAAAARAAVELSRSESQNRGGSSGQSTPRTPQKATTPDGKGGGSLTEKAQPFRTYSSGSESSPAKRVIFSSEGELASPSSSKSGDIPWQREKTRGYDRIVGEKNSDEGVVKLKDQSQAPAIETGWRAVPGNPSRRKPYEEDSSSSDDDEITPRKTALQRSNQEKRQQEFPKSGLAHWKEEDDQEEDEEGPATRKAARLKGEQRPRIRDPLLQQRQGMENRPVSMRTRRSAF